MWSCLFPECQMTFYASFYLHALIPAILVAVASGVIGARWAWVMCVLRATVRERIAKTQRRVKNMKVHRSENGVNSREASADAAKHIQWSVSPMRAAATRSSSPRGAPGSPGNPSEVAHSTAAAADSNDSRMLRSRYTGLMKTAIVVLFFTVYTRVSKVLLHSWSVPSACCSC